MAITNIPFTEIDSIPVLIKDYINGKLDDFNEDTFSIENFEHKIVQKQMNFGQHQREMLHQVFTEQNKESKLSELQIKNLEDLKSANTFTITTGHQLNLYSGPVFFVYKILQTIKTCQFLSQKFPEKIFVPIYWMASEDHDFEEINHFKTKSNYYEQKEKSGGPVGEIIIHDLSFVTEFEAEFKDDIFGNELILMLKEAYKKGNSLAKAIRTLVQRLFSEYGLLILDGNNTLLKSQMIDIFKDELLNSSLHRESKDKVDFLKKNYNQVQVNPRLINLFYLSETRNRIEKTGNKYVVVDTNIEFSESEILLELEKFPEKFSPNAILRPIYQEKILPNLAYIGGNAEIMYWLELKDYYRYLKLPFPILIPRNSMLMLNQKTIAKIEKAQLEIKDFFTNFSKVIERKLLTNNEIQDLLAEQEEKLKVEFVNLRLKAKLTDPTFENMVQAEEKRQLKSFDRFHKRLLKAEKIKQSERLELLENLFILVHPRKIWQERVYNFSVFYSELGKDWLGTCLEEIDPEKSQLSVIVI